jgi:hypothetical protein
MDSTTLPSTALPDADVMPAQVERDGEKRRAGPPVDRIEGQ